MKDLLVVVDMVNGFINFGNLSDKKINEITPNIEKMIKKAIENGDSIVAFRDCHEKNDIEFETFPEHCLDGSEESELIPELVPYAKYMKIIKKPTTNGFNTLEFQEYIANHEFNNIYVCGCCTDICVLNFCESLKGYLNKNKIASNIIVNENSVSTFDGENHNAKIVNLESLKKMQDLGIDIVYNEKESFIEEK